MRNELRPNMFRRTGKLIAIAEIDRFWAKVRENYRGTNFFVMSWLGPWGKPHLKSCREDQ